MFTGLVQDIGRIVSVQHRKSGSSLQIHTQIDTSDWEIGESIAVQGACLTVTKIENQCFWADCSLETLTRTTLDQCVTDSLVHLERALIMGDRLGGHLVSGHIDGIGNIKTVQPQGNAWSVEIHPPNNLRKYMIEKGSIAIDGVSLTINQLTETSFFLAIIPHTLEKTLFQHFKPGTDVNLEVDMIGKYIEQFVSPWAKENTPFSKQTINEKFLK